jgi:Na+/melibiose symporter-like transporter
MKTANRDADFIGWGKVWKRLEFSLYPAGLDKVSRANYCNVQIDAVGIGLASAASPFLPVFLARLGADAFSVGLLTAMPAVAGLIFSLAIGHFLHTRRSIVPWFSYSRFLVVSAYAATGTAPFFVPRQYLIPAVIGIWALATIPQTVVNTAFSVVMNSVAGPSGRYELLSRRWTILGFTSALFVLIAGELLDWIGFPVNYQVVFLGLSVGGLISLYFSSHIVLPEHAPEAGKRSAAWRDTLGEYVRLVRARPDFLSFALKRFVFFCGVTIAQPILPLYYVNTVKTTDAWIGAISMVATVTMLFGYPLWARQSRVRGSRFVLLATTFGVGMFPVLVAATRRVEVIVLLAGMAGVFQAGVDLVFFDELMKTVPEEYCAMFVSVAQLFQYLATVIAPLVGTLLADRTGLGGALVAASVLRLAGTALFAIPRSPPRRFGPSGHEKKPEEHQKFYAKTSLCSFELSRARPVGLNAEGGRRDANAIIPSIRMF